MDREGKGASSSGNGPMAYYEVLRLYKRFRILWIGELINQSGNWFSYVAALTKVEQLSGNTGFLLSLVLITHFLPNLVFFPITGVVADRFPRENTLLYSCACAAVTSALIPLIQRARDLWLLYVLLFLQYSAGGFYDPARRALQPTLVPDTDLGLAATLDTFAWSLMSAVGGSLGGYAVSAIGTTGCFLLDCVTYIAAGMCAHLLVTTKDVKCSSEPVVGIPLATISSRARNFKKINSGPDFGIPAAEVVKSPADVHDSWSRQSGEDNYPPRVAVTSAQEEEQEHDDENEAQFLLRGQEPSAAHGNFSTTRGDPRDHVGLPVLVEGGEALVTPWWRLLMSSFGREVGALREGWAYILQHSNRDVAAIIAIKGGGSLVWGASDLFNVHFAAMPQMQTLGDQSMTLGLIFSSVGVGCLVGPVAFNMFTPTRRLPLLFSTLLGYFFMLVSYLIMGVAPNVWMVLFSTAVRAVGSSTTWIYSTLLIQLRVPNALLGRMLALEMAIFTASECVSGIFGGAAFDVWHWSVQEAVLVMAAIAGGVCLVFSGYVIAVARGGGGAPEYDALHTADYNDDDCSGSDAEEGTRCQAQP